MWLVYDDQNGIVGKFDDRKDAEQAYQECVDDVLNHAQDSGSFSQEDNVILAKIEKQSFVVDTKEPVIKEDEHGNKNDTGDTYHRLKEETY